MKICPECNKSFPDKGIHTHMMRAHGSDEIKSKFSSGNHGRYVELSQRAADERHIRDSLKRKNHDKKCEECGSIVPYSEYKVRKYCSPRCSAKNSPRKEWTVEKKLQFSLKMKSIIRSKPTYKKRLEKTEINENRICVICCENFRSRTPRKTCSIDCRRLLQSRNSASNPNCGGKRNSHRIRYNNAGTEVILDSTYEFRFAEILKNLNVSWVRPKHLTYIDARGNKRRYHPDFFIPIINIYIDTKNDYLISVDSEKIHQVSIQNDVEIIILSDRDLNMNSVETMLRRYT